MGVRFPTDGANGKVKNFPKNLYFSLIAYKNISCLSHYKPIKLYYLWVPHGLLQLARNPQCDTHRDRVMRIRGSSQWTP